MSKRKASWQSLEWGSLSHAVNKNVIWNQKWSHEVKDFPHQELQLTSNKYVMDLPGFLYSVPGVHQKASGHHREGWPASQASVLSHWSASASGDLLAQGRRRLSCSPWAPNVRAAQGRPVLHRQHQEHGWRRVHVPGWERGWGHHCQRHRHHPGWVPLKGIGLEGVSFLLNILQCTLRFSWRRKVLLQQMDIFSVVGRVCVCRGGCLFGLAHLCLVQQI